MINNFNITNINIDKLNKNIKEFQISNQFSPYIFTNSDTIGAVSYTHLLSDLQYAADCLGFYSYNDITEIGEWIFDYETGYFSKNKKSTFVQELSDKYVEILKECRSINYHEYADNTLLKLLSDLGYADVVKEYKHIPKLYF